MKVLFEFSAGRVETMEITVSDGIKWINATADRRATLAAAATVYGLWSDSRLTHEEMPLLKRVVAEVLSSGGGITRVDMTHDVRKISELRRDDA